ncbi:DUF6707 family protein [Arthrobacter sp. 35W]|uniref:DUF6707 family protein n=1 Tax=Arthrobacter sp. 35W TaxID=1132441 RepID=UPI0003FD4928|nr:DUF6707 family protein [Arthrobacter sp. 35W]
MHADPLKTLVPGTTITTPGGEVVVATAVGWERDDYGQPAVAVVEYDGGSVRIAAGTTATVLARPKPALPPSQLPAADPAVLAGILSAAAAAHGAHESVQRLTARLGKGFNPRSGANLADLKDLAQVLFVQLNDPANARAVLGLLTDLPYDSTPGRWSSIEQALALEHYMARADDPLRADQLAYALRAPDRAELDAFRAKTNAEVRQRTLNEPNLYTKEITRAVDTGERAAELQWRELRLNVLLHLLAHGGSQTLDDAELERRIAEELERLRAGWARGGEGSAASTAPAAPRPLPGT